MCLKLMASSFLSRWWDLRSGEMTHSVDFGSPITSLEMSAPSSTLTITSGRKVSFVPFLHGSAPTHTLTLTYAPSSASLYPVSPDRFITGSMDDPWVRLHTLDGTEKEVLKAHHGPVHCVEFSPDGELYASGSGESRSTVTNLLLNILEFCSEDGMIDSSWRDGY